MASCPQQVAAVDELGEPLATDPGIGAAMMHRVGQLFCGLHGHDEMLQFSGGRMFLRCSTCGHESPGWDLPTRIQAKVEPARARLVPKMPAKRVA